MNDVRSTTVPAKNLVARLEVPTQRGGAKSQFAAAVEASPLDRLTAQDLKDVFDGLFKGTGLRASERETQVYESTMRVLSSLDQPRLKVASEVLATRLDMVSARLGQSSPMAEAIRRSPKSSLNANEVTDLFEATARTADRPISMADLGVYLSVVGLLTSPSASAAFAFQDTGEER